MGHDQTDFAAISATDGTAWHATADDAHYPRTFTGDSVLHDDTTLSHWRSKPPVRRDRRISAWSQMHCWLAAWQLDDANQYVLLLHNLSGQPQQLTLPVASVHAVPRQNDSAISLKNRRLQLPPYSSAILG